MATDNNAIATQMVDDRPGYKGVSKIPDSVREWAISTVAKRLGELEKLSKGIQQYGPDGEVSYISPDPLKPVYSTIDKYRGIGAVG